MTTDLDKLHADAEAILDEWQEQSHSTLPNVRTQAAIGVFRALLEGIAEMRREKDEALAKGACCDYGSWITAERDALQRDLDAEKRNVAALQFELNRRS